MSRDDNCVAPSPGSSFAGRVITATEAAGFAGAVLKGTDFRNSTLHNLSFAGSELIGVDFSDAKLHHVDLTGARLEDCYFKDAKLSRCRFVRARIDRVSFERSTLELCDFYRASYVSSVVLRNTVMTRCSLHLTELQGAELRLASLHGLAQEDPQSLRILHEMGQMDSRESKGLCKPRNRLYGALETYQGLVGHFESKGLYRDATTAYVMSKRTETSREVALAMHHKGTSRYRHLLAASLLWLADQACGFGTSLARTARMWVMLVVAGSVVIALGSDRSAGWMGTIETATSNATGQGLGDATVVASWARLVAMVLAVGSIAVVGLLGFVLGNKLRYD